MKHRSVLLVIPLLSSLFFASCKNTNDKKEEEQQKAELFSGYEITNENAERKTSGIEQINIFGINDFHGSIKENYQEAGIANIGTFIKQKTSQPNTLFIDSGDTWQGSLESNYNHGKLITEVYNNAKISARIVGNHDFDWGTDVFANNVKESNFPNLAANVFDYNWDNKKVGEKQQERFGKSYATYVLDNGLKIGIIGTIGAEQITSISTQLVSDIAFTNQNTLIQEISDYLRVEKNCDLIIASTHSSYKQISPFQLTKISDVSNKRYVDLVLNAHTHEDTCYTFDTVKFAQFGSNGQEIGQVKLYYNFETNQLVDLSTDVITYSKTQIINEINNTVDPEIQQIVNKYDAETKDLGDQVLSTNFSGSFYSTEQLPNLMAESIYKEAYNEGYTVDFAYTNPARASHYASKMTYSDLYNIFPFDNAIPIIEVTGRDATNMLRFKNNLYRGNPDLEIRYEGVYKVACLDYLAFHCDENRDYDNFPDMKVLGYLTKNNENYLYRDVLKDYLLSNPEKTFEASYYSFTNPIFAREG